MKDKLIKNGMKVGGSFFSGWISLFKSFSFIGENKKLIKYFVIPFIINMVLLTSLFYFSFENINPLLQQYLSGDFWFFVLIKPFIKLILFVLLLLIIVFLYSILGGIITAPFNDILSQRVEIIKGIKQNEEKFSISAATLDIIRVVKNLIKMVIFLIIINMFFFVLNLIPGLGTMLYGFLSFIFAMFFLGFQFFDFSLERRGLTFWQKMKIAWKFKMMVVGIGSGFFVISAIPIVGFLSLNVATVGATTLFVDNINPVLQDGTIKTEK